MSTHTPFPSSPRHLLALCCAALSLHTAQVQAQPLGEVPPGLVSAERLQQKEAELKVLLAELKKLRADLQAAEARLKEANAKRPSDPEPGIRQLALLQAELVESRKRIALLESQLRDAERQRDEARVAAQRAQAAARSTADPDPALRSERDRLKRELARSGEERDRLQAEVRQVQQALQIARVAAAASSVHVTVLAPRNTPAPVQSVTERTEPKATLVDGSELTVPGCSAACPSFIVLPNEPFRKATSEPNRVSFTVFKTRLAMGKTEVTIAQWKHFMADSGYRLPANNAAPYCDWQKEAVSDQHPVRCVSAEDADAYAAWFHKKYAAQVHAAVKQLGLPTEDEWEYAARAGRWTQERQWDEGKENCKLAASASCTGNTPDPVAKQGRSPNAWGLYDMIGNVFEWTTTSLTGGASRVLRGGSFHISGDHLRLSARHTYAPVVRLDFIGFRLLARIDL